MIKERAEVSTHLMKDEMEEMKQVLEAKSKRVAQLEDHNRKLTMAVQQHRQHGDIYFTKVKGGFEYVQGMYMMQCKNSKVSPMKTESREPPSFKRSFEEFVADQNQSFPSSSQTLDMSELGMDLLASKQLKTFKPGLGGQGGWRGLSSAAASGRGPVAAGGSWGVPVTSPPCARCCGRLLVAV